MKKKLTLILSLIVALTFCIGCFVACQSGLTSDQLDNLYKEFTKLHRNDATESPVSYWVEGDVFYLEDGGEEISAKIQWAIEGTTLVKVGETPNNLGQFQVIVPDDVSAAVNYKLIGTLVDENGNTYKNADGEVYKLEISKTIPAGLGKGTEESPYSVAGALAEFATVPSKGFSENKFYVQGIVITVPSYNSKYQSYSFWIADSKDSDKKLQIYSGSLKSGIEKVCQNDTVVVHGYYMNYSATNPEMTGSSASGDTPARDYPVVTTRTIGTSTISYSPSENAEIVLNKTSGTNGETFTFTVTAKNNATISSVKVNGKEVTATSANNYSGTIDGDTTVTVVALIASAGEQTATIDMAANFATYAKDWTNSYSAQELDSAALGINNLSVLIAFERVAKQTQTITTLPVMAPNSNTNPTYTTFSVQGGKHIKSLTIELEMWSASKKFKTIAFEYTTDGTNWTPIDGVGIKDAETAVNLGDYTNLSVTDLPANVTGVRLVLLSGYESGNQQVGLKKVVIVSD